MLIAMATIEPNAQAAKISTQHNKMTTLPTETAQALVDSFDAVAFHISLTEWGCE
jgi:hypothetical protein